MAALSSHRFFLYLVVGLLLLGVPAFSQTESAAISGTVTDQSGAVMEGARVTLTNVETGVTATTESNGAGLYVFSSVRPGQYRILVEKTGFKQIALTNLTVNVQDTLSRNFTLQVGAAGESVTVNGEQVSVNTDSAAVGTVIDSKFVGNLPMNGRTFQTLIQLAPGVVLTPTNYSSDPSNGDSGQFSVNGQRANGNYFTVDGVSANFGIGTQVDFTQSTSGTLPATNKQGSFASLVSADALQEFKIQTSTFAPEFGRTPGAQISLVTKSGTNQFHGSVYEYLRNDATDAKDWFDTTKPPLRFNDFGATIGGPIWKNKTFFFFAYEGQRFTLPQPTLGIAVPSQAVRDAAPNATARQLLDAFPVPNGPVILDPLGNPTDAAMFSKAYSSPNNADSYAIRVDHNFNARFSLFGRFNQSPSNSFQRNSQNLSIGSVQNTKTRTETLGSSMSLSNTLLNEVRINNSQQWSDAVNIFDGFGGGKEPDPKLFIGNNSLADSNYSYFIFSITTGTAEPAGVALGTSGTARTRSVNFVDNLSWIKGKHALKFGIDYRWYSPASPAQKAGVGEYFLFTQAVYDLSAQIQVLGRGSEVNTVAPNYSLYAQDTWNLNPRLTMTYGLRWEINPAPHTNGSQGIVTLSKPPDFTSFDQSGLQLAPLGTPYYPTEFNKIAPRLGLAYQLSGKQNRETIVRAGGGLFYDLNSTPFSSTGWPYSYGSFGFGAFPIPVPVSALDFPPPDFTPSPANRASVSAAAKDFTLPRVYQWNLSIQQALGADQSVTVGYVGSAGRKLLRSFDIGMTTTPSPGVFYSPNFNDVQYADNASKSDYNSLQLQFVRRLSKGLQLIGNYTWSHSTDDVSTTSQFFSPGYIYDPSVEHGASTFDVRHNFTAAFYYEVPTPKWNTVSEHILGNWAVSGTWIARSGLPFNVRMEEIGQLGYVTYARRPDVVPGVPLIIHDSAAPGGWKLNNAVDSSGNPVAFTAPPGTVQGNMGRNSIYGFGAWQSDLGLHRTFHIMERLNAEFRLEAFNVFNHPNFANPSAYAQYFFGQWTFSNTYPNVFGQSNATMARGYNGGTGLNPLFQVGGPRSVQASLRFTF